MIGINFTANVFVDITGRMLNVHREVEELVVLRNFAAGQWGGNEPAAFYLTSEPGFDMLSVVSHR